MDVPRDLSVEENVDLSATGTSGASAALIREGLNVAVQLLICVSNIEYCDGIQSQSLHTMGLLSFISPCFWWL